MDIRSPPTAIRVSGDSYFAYPPHWKKAEEVQRMLSQFETAQTVNLDGTTLTVAQVAAIARRPTVAVAQDDAVGKELVTQSAERMAETIAHVAAEYGITLSHRATSQLLCSLNAGVIGEETLPWSYSKAAMLVLTNILMQGNSGIRWEILQAIIRLMNHNLIPKLPLGGITTASGDLVPFSYIASAMSGSDNSRVDTPEGGEISSIEALKRAGIMNGPFELQANEVVGLVNGGTAVGLAVAAIVCFDANVLAGLAEILSAMFCEVTNGKPAFEWLGPQLEVIRTATNLIENMINSANDSAVIDGIAFCDEMNKLLIAMAAIGKQISDQFSELNCKYYKKGLPSKNTMDDNCSKLQNLNNPVTNHVGGYSIGLKSAQKSVEAVEILKLMSATYMVALCQVFDLHHMEENVREVVKHIVLQTVRMTLYTAEYDGSLLEALEKELAQLSFSEDPIYASHTLASQLRNFLNEKAKALAGNDDFGFSIFMRIEEFNKKLKNRLWAEVPEVMKKFKGGDFVVGNRIEKCSTYPMYQFVRMEMPRGGHTMCPGEWIEKVYEAIGEGKLEEVVLKCLASFTPMPSGWFEWARSLVAVVAETGRFLNF